MYSFSCISILKAAFVVFKPCVWAKRTDRNSGLTRICCPCHAWRSFRHPQRLTSQVREVGLNCCSERREAIQGWSGEFGRSSWRETGVGEGRAFVCRTPVGEVDLLFPSQSHTRHTKNKNLRIEFNLLEFSVLKPSWRCFGCGHHNLIRVSIVLNSTVF